MNIRIFLLNHEKNSYAARLAPELAFLFEKQLPAEGGVRTYPSIRDAANEVSAAFSDSHAILFLAEPARFAETKKALAASVGLNLSSGIPWRGKTPISLSPTLTRRKTAARSSARTGCTPVFR